MGFPEYGRPGEQIGFIYPDIAKMKCPYFYNILCVKLTMANIPKENGRVCICTEYSNNLSLKYKGFFLPYAMINHFNRKFDNNLIRRLDVFIH